MRVISHRLCASALFSLASLRQGVHEVCEDAQRQRQREESLALDHQRFMQALDEQADEVAARCTVCARCVQVCPMPSVEGLAIDEPAQVVAGVVALLHGGEASRASKAWMAACTGSGHCIEACPEGINPRQMIALARVRERSRQMPLQDRKKDGAAQYRSMSRGVKVLSRLQLTKDELRRFDSRDRADEVPDPEVVFYTGCNILKTPHIVLLCLDVLDALGVRYHVRGGANECCGVYQLRGADPRSAARLASSTLQKISSGDARILSWCPSCQVTFGDMVQPVMQRAFDEPPASMEPFIVYLAEHIDQLMPHFKHRVNKRVALHEHSGFAGVHQAVRRLLEAVPGLEWVELETEPLGYMCSSLYNVPATRRALHRSELNAAKRKGVDMLVGVYHACHRDLCAHESEWPFEVVNFMEIIGRAMGLNRPDHFKQLKILRDVDAVLEASADRIAEHGLDLNEVREVVAQDLLGEQSLPLTGQSVNR